MVLISSKKYACETCIKGHRSSTCKHTDRPLFEIKKKGRPVTQCEHCRELRKTRQVHGKCICQGKESTETAVPKKKQKSSPVMPAHTAFPHGVPEALAAEAVFETTDSSHDGSASAASSSNPNSNSNPTTIPSPPIPSQQPPTSHHVLARVAELRRVLPRPSPLGTGEHDLVHAHTIPHAHPEHFSPYARAHDCAVGSLYQHDVGALSSESLHSSVSRKSRKSHSTSSSCDGMAGQTFLDEPIEWHLPPNLARSTAKTDGLIPLPWSTDDANYHRSANIDAGHHSDDVGDAGVRTCPLDDGETTRCTAAACGGACLNCTLLSLPYFSPIDGLKDGAFEVLGSGANGHKEYEPVSVELGFELQFGSEAEGNSGGGPGSGVLDEQAIDEWLRGVGALPPASELSESPPPSDFGDALGANGLLGNFNFGDEDATFAAGGEQQEGVLLADANFPPEVQFGQLAWMFDLDVGGAPVYGLGDMCFLEAYTRSCSTSSGSASSALSVA